MIELESAGSGTLSVGLPQALPVDAAAVASDSSTVVYGKQASNTSVALHAFEDGVRVHTILADSSAPTSFTYPVSIPANGSVEKVLGGAVVILDAEGEAVGYLGTPWARDAANKVVATHFDVVGSSVVQSVEHNVPGITYPVVADPYLFKDLIKSAKWAYVNYAPGKGGWTLQVTPTGWARSLAGAWLPGHYGWRELYKKYKNRGLRVNLGGMRDQYICHQQVVAIRQPNKKTWNLDEWRRDTSYARTVRASCNPAP